MNRLFFEISVGVPTCTRIYFTAQKTRSVTKVDLMGNIFLIGTIRAIRTILWFKKKKVLLLLLGVQIISGKNVRYYTRYERIPTRKIIIIMIDKKKTIVRTACVYINI